MVGDDQATGTFKQWWETAGVLRGGVLVYNTGRCGAAVRREVGWGLGSGSPAPPLLTLLTRLLAQGAGVVRAAAGLQALPGTPGCADQCE
jgi:hypothetical protein